MTQLEYIESTGTQYINTQYLPAANSAYEIEIMILPQTSPYAAPFGSERRNTWDGSYVCVTNGSSTNRQLAYSWGGAGGTISAVDISSYYGKRVTISLSSVEVRIEDQDGNYRSIAIGHPGRAESYPILIFTINVQGTPSSDTSCIMRLYRFRIYTGNTLVRDFLPALDNGGVPCVLDEVSDQFFYNAGTGSFIYEQPTPPEPPHFDTKTLIMCGLSMAMTRQNVIGGKGGGSSSVFSPAFKYSVQQNGNSPSIVLDKGGRSYLTKAGAWGGYYCFGTLIPRTARRVTLHLSAADAGGQYHRNIRVGYRSDYAATDGGEWKVDEPAIPLAWILSSNMTVEELLNQWHIISLQLTSNVNLAEQDVVIDVSHVHIDFYLVVTQANVVPQLYSISYE